MVAGRGELWRDGDFMKLWGAQAVSSFGARIAREGLPLTAVWALGAAPTSMGLMAALAIAPAVLVGLAGGALADRLPRRPLLILADLARAAVLAAVPIAALIGRLSLAEVYVAAALVGGLSALFDVADHAFLPQLIERRLLLEANAKLAATDSVAETGGPALAGLLFQLLGAPVAVAVNALTYLVSAGLLAGIRGRRGAAPTGPPAPLDLDLSSGLRACLAQPLVRPLLMMGLVQGLFGGFFSALYILYAVKVLGLTPAMLGLTIACGGAGSLAGALLAPRISARFGPGPTIIASGFATGASALLIPLAGGGPVAGMIFLMAAQILGDCLGTVFEIGAVSLRQAAIAPAALGRAGGAFISGQGLMTVLGALAGGVLAQAIGVRQTLYIAAAGVALAPLLALASPLRRQRDPLPAPAAET